MSVRTTTSRPFLVEGLLARERALLRRPADLPEQTLTIRRLLIDPVHLTIGSSRMDIPRRELLVLQAEKSASKADCQEQSIDPASKMQQAVDP